MRLEELKPNIGSKKKSNRVGRGPGLVTVRQREKDIKAKKPAPAE